MTDVGILTIHVLACKELKDKDWFSENDPYVVLHLTGGDGRAGAGQADNQGGRAVTVRTKTLHGAGKNPKWTNEIHDFQIVPRKGLAMEVEVFDYDDDGSSDSIGKTVLALDSVFTRKSGQRTEKFYDIFSKKSGKVNGQVQLGVVWTGPADIYEAPPAMPPAPAPQPVAPAPAHQPQPAAPPNPDEIRAWYYVDPQGATQGPHTAVEMRGWSSYFAQTTQVMAPGAQSWQPLSSYPQIGGKPVAPPPAPAPAPLPAPMPAATRQPTLLQITCPQGVYAGQTIYTQTPAGVQLAVTVPPGVQPGMPFNVQC
jgi:hypothetical protein